MPRTSIVPEILALLEPYLRQRSSDFKTNGEVTLPLTPDGKVNVSAIAEEIGLATNQRQHLYKPEIAEVINLAAAAQEVGGIGARGGFDPGAAEIALAQRRASEAMSLLAEREAVIVALRREIVTLRARLSLVTETGMTMRVGTD